MAVPEPGLCPLTPIRGDFRGIAVLTALCCPAALKEQGNEAFRAGDFPLAIQRYSEGLQRLRDKQELYTNRAQVSGRPAATSGWVLCGCARIKPQNILLLAMVSPCSYRASGTKSFPFPVSFKYSDFFLINVFSESFL